MSPNERGLLIGLVATLVISLTATNIFFTIEARNEARRGKEAYERSFAGVDSMYAAILSKKEELAKLQSLGAQEKRQGTSVLRSDIISVGEELNKIMSKNKVIVEQYAIVHEAKHHLVNYAISGRVEGIVAAIGEICSPNNGLIISRCDIKLTEGSDKAEAAINVGYEE